jgi:D-sedoheptulose 7-phosphate isomerase
MNYYDIIAGNFQATIESIAMSVDDLAGPIEGASQLMAQALLEDRKIIACGNGADGAIAQLFAANLLNRFEHDRPALPALALGGDGPGITAIAQAGGINDIFSRPLRALGQPGDVLLCINSDSGANNLLRAVQAAHERNMTVIILSNGGDTQLGTLIRSEDIEISVDAPRQARIVELHTMVVHCLCELLDHSLFGSYNQE